MELKENQFIKVKVENVMYPYRDRYAFHIPEFNYYEGKVIYQQWFKPGEVGITTGDPNFEFRVIQKERIVEVNDEKSEFPKQSLSARKDSEGHRISVKGKTGNLYEVQIGGRWGSSCSCKGYQFRRTCRHIAEAESQVAA